MAADRRQPSRGSGDIQDWCDQHGVIRELMPFAYREVDPVDLAAEIRSGLDDLPDTAATFALKDVTDDAKAISGVTDALLLAVGSWRTPREHSSATRWVNPNYPHQKALDDISTDRRLEHCRRAASVGTVQLGDLAPRFGVGQPALSIWLDGRMDWRAERREGRRRLARTLRTAVAWGHDRSAVTALWPLEQATINQWLSAHASEFDVPSDPSYSTAAFQRGKDRGRGR